MRIHLRSHGRSFATRERAYDLIKTVGKPDKLECELDIEGVMASPSFLAELLGLLVEREATVVVVGADEFQKRTVASLIRQLGFSDSVRQAEVAR